MGLQGAGAVTGMLRSGALLRAPSLEESRHRDQAPVDRVRGEPEALQGERAQQRFRPGLAKDDDVGWERAPMRTRAQAMPHATSRPSARTNSHFSSTVRPIRSRRSLGQVV
jgi:hypothetical protein